MFLSNLNKNICIFGAKKLIVKPQQEVEPIETIGSSDEEKGEIEEKEHKEHSEKISRKGSTIFMVKRISIAMITGNILSEDYFIDDDDRKKKDENDRKEREEKESIGNNASMQEAVDLIG